jgi:uncharacterized protein (TIGR00725 family)
MKPALNRDVIAVVGSAKLSESSEEYSLAHKLGSTLVSAGFRVLTGGLEGVMEAVSCGEKASPSYTPGDIIGAIPGHGFSQVNDAVDIIIPTGLDIYRNGIVAHAKAMIAVGGGAGTPSEMALAWSLKRLIIAFRVEGWSERLADTRIDERIRHSSIPDDKEFVLNPFKNVSSY